MTAPPSDDRRRDASGFADLRDGHALLDEEELLGSGRVVRIGPGADGDPELATDYLGLALRVPVVASAGPLTGSLAGLRELDAAGVGAVVLPSLFEEQIEHEVAAAQQRAGADVNPEATTGYAPMLDTYNRGIERYVRLVGDAREALSVPVIASLNGVTAGGWTEYARMLGSAGAHALELNIYRIAAGDELTGAEVEAQTLRVVEAVVAACEVPVAVKLSPYWSSLGNFAPRVLEAGAAGLVLFNRFYQPDIALATLSVEPRLVLSSTDELRLPLRWMALLHGRVAGYLAASTGVHTAQDLAKVLLAGADVAMTTSALLENGAGHVATLVDGLRAWMQEHDYASVAQLRGSVSQANVRDPAAFERANYLDTISTYTRNLSLS